MIADMSDTLALIPLRAGSKGLPGKNTRALAGIPLWRHAVAQARAAGISRVVVSTDIASLLAAPYEPGLEILARPSELAADDTPMDAVLNYVLSAQLRGAARVVLLQATSPLRQPADITAARELHARGTFDLVLSATCADRGVLKWGRAEGAEFLPLSDPAYCFANRAALPPVYRPNGAVYVFDADWFRGAGTLAGGRIGIVEMPPDRSADIDTISDFAAAEAQLRMAGGAE